MFSKITTIVLSILLVGGLAYYHRYLKKPERPVCDLALKAQQCWEAQIEYALEDSLEQAFTVLADLYAAEPAFASECHGYVHRLGEAAYEKFARQEPFRLTAKTAYCGYGFYHGFMETLLFGGGTMDEARKFCNDIKNILGGGTGDAVGACYHGVGHGFVDGSDPTVWGSAEKIVAPGLGFCDQAADTDYNKTRCASGVFNSLAVAYSGKKYGLAAHEKNVFSICDQQVKRYFKRPCYEEMNTFLMVLGDNQFVSAAKLIQDIQDDSYALPAMQSLAGAAAMFNKPKLENGEMLAACRSVPQKFKSACIMGFVGGIIEAGAGEEFQAALDFCRSMTASDERTPCYERMMAYLSSIYSKERFAEVCAEIKSEFQSKYCDER